MNVNSQLLVVRKTDQGLSNSLKHDQVDLRVIVRDEWQKRDSSMLLLPKDMRLLLVGQPAFKPTADNQDFTSQFSPHKPVSISKASSQSHFLKCLISRHGNEEDLLCRPGRCRHFHVGGHGLYH
ncbi:uncharacterized protein G2W53_022340 [Senna tora]|uniref:Uncharacterized protein n=1 Tax=Senna tora TaxID=362788 RepID=A0A834WM04_9FABA|nr:uncharacterized protein G2W53_022340 [Senna tora]